MSKRQSKTSAKADALADFKAHVPKPTGQRLLDRPQYAQFREYVETLLELNAELMASMESGEQGAGGAVMAMQAIADGAIKKYKLACSARTVIEWMKFTYPDLSKTTLAGRHG